MLTCARTAPSLGAASLIAALSTRPFPPFSCPPRDRALQHADVRSHRRALAAEAAPAVHRRAWVR